MSKQTSLENLITEFFANFGIDPDIIIDELENDVFSIKIEGNDLNYLIGYRGQSLDALQTLLGQMFFKQTGEWITTTVDINGYKDSKTEKLHEITKRYIDKVRFFESEVKLPPMKPWERRQIHLFVEEYNDVTSESEGEGRNRRVVLKPSKK